MFRGFVASDGSAAGSFAFFLPYAYILADVISSLNNRNLQYVGSGILYMERFVYGTEIGGRSVSR